MDAGACLAMHQRLHAQYPGAQLPQCWYSDATLAVTGVAPPARCLTSPLPTCGTGCAPCPADNFCMYESERYPTGVCLITSASGTARSEPCGGRAGGCHRLGDACLKPVRGTVDGWRDTDRWGTCVPVDACQGVAAALPDGYRCDPTLGPHDN